MGIQLDWEVESESSVQRSLGEDPDARRRRRRNLAGMLFVTLVLGGLFLGAGAFIVDQIQQVNQEIEDELRNTVQAEITALRIGDWQAFSTFQRSADESWLRRQRTEFEAYQTLLFEREEVQLTGQVLDIEIDDPRARVQVQEIIDGVPYTRTWFYYTYEDRNETGEVQNVGWYHVPPDYTFWGESQQYVGDYLTVAYREVDSLFASSLGQAMDEWIDAACNALDCAELPAIRIQVAPQDRQEMAWAPGALRGDPWVMIISSPYADRARSDRPFDPRWRLEVATLLADRLVAYQMNGQQVFVNSDANYFRSAAVNWLVGRFVQVDTGAYLVESLAQNYGMETVGALLRQMPPDATIGFLTDITGVTLDQLPVDWRDFFTWRLRREQSYANDGLLNDFLQLYHAQDPAVRIVAEERFQQKLITESYTVVSTGFTTPADTGEIQLIATVRNEDETLGTLDFQVLFRLVDNRWLRAS
jgi:hypothetical protein